MCMDCPRYSCVIWSSGIICVCCIDPKRGLNGSRGWKSIGPFFICIITLSRNVPSSGMNSRYARQALSLPVAE